MRHSIFILTLLGILSCNPDPTDKVSETTKITSDCLPGKDTVIIIATFKIDTGKTPTETFYSIVDLISRKGYFKPLYDKADKLKVRSRTSLTYPVAYDTCNMIRIIEKTFIMNNIKVSSCDFKAIRPEQGTKNLFGGLHFEEWKFASNLDRDSAYKIINMVYNYPNNIVAYEKRYSQFILDDKRIFLLEGRAKFNEHYAIEYKKIMQAFISKK